MPLSDVIRIEINIRDVTVEQLKAALDSEKFDQVIQQSTEALGEERSLKGALYAVRSRAYLGKQDWVRALRDAGEVRFCVCSQL